MLLSPLSQILKIIDCLGLTFWWRSRNHIVLEFWPVSFWTDSIIINHHIKSNLNIFPFLFLYSLFSLFSHLVVLVFVSLVTFELADNEFHLFPLVGINFNVHSLSHQFSISFPFNLKPQVDIVFLQSILLSNQHVIQCNLLMKRWLEVVWSVCVSAGSFFNFEFIESQFAVLRVLLDLIIAYGLSHSPFL